MTMEITSEMILEMTPEMIPEMISELTGDQVEIGDPDGCPLTVVLQEFHDEVHRDVVPALAWDQKWLQFTHQ